MRIRHIVWKELWHRKGGTLLILLGVTLCVGLVVMFQRIGEGSTEEMRRIMNRMGKNLVIVPADATLAEYLGGRLGDVTFPQEYMGLAAKRQGGLAGHFQGSLQRRVEIMGDSLVLCGLTAENPIGSTGSDHSHATGSRRLERGEAELGSSAAKRLDAKVGEMILIPFFGKGGGVGGPPRMGPPGMRSGPLGKKSKGGPHMVKVTRIHDAAGSIDDFKVYVDISVASAQLGVPDKQINVIEAMSYVTGKERAGEVVALLNDALKDEKVATRTYLLKAKAEGRRRGRWENARMMNYLSAGVFVLGAIIIAGLAVMNVRGRRKEMGVLLAIAARPRHIAWMLVQKMFVLALVGGLLGCWLGHLAALRWGPPLLATLHPDLWIAYGRAVAAALALTLAPALTAALIAAHTDPADTVRGL
jgi:putative ABC transport system permease protein